VRILHVIPSMDAQSGGPPRVVANLAMAQARQGCEVSVLSTDGGEPQELYEKLGIAMWPNAAVSTACVASKRRGGLLSRAFGRDLLETAIGDSAVVHVHGVWEPLLHRALRIAGKCKRRTVITPHGMVSHYGMQKKKLKKIAGMTLYARKGLQNATLVQALTSTEAKEILHYIPGANVQVIANGIHAEEFASRPGRSVVSRAVPELADRAYVLFLARLDYMKGIDQLIQAFALAQPRALELRLVIAGPDFGAEEESKQLVATLGLQAKVHFLGPVSGELKRALLAHAVCLMQPSRHEGFSLSLLEALASGTPIVVSNRIDLPGLSEMRAGRFAELEPAALADAMLEYVFDGEARESISSRTRQLVLERYTWEIIARQLAAFLPPTHFVKT
jgi:glycosyltransferase involved in cell wall biosynthesis